MKKLAFILTKGAFAGGSLTALAIFGLLAILGLNQLPSLSEVETNMFLTPEKKIARVGEFIIVNVIVESKVPVNVFAGELHFDTSVLTIQAIDYNTSIADLWVELPWYNNGAGTLTFGGGTTRPGGFTGTDTLITVTFKTKTVGEGLISIHQPRILLHDGLGTDSNINTTIDTIINVSNTTQYTEMILNPLDTSARYTILTKAPSIDLNGDGKQGIADISIFMLNIAGSDPRYDFNLDGKVDIKDLNILLSSK